MTEAEFTENLDRWGTIDHWPQADRTSASRLLKQSAFAREQLARAREMETLLAVELRAPAHIRRQIVARVPDDVWQRAADWLGSRFWRPTVAAMCVLAVGFSLGLMSAGEEFDDTDVGEISLLTIDGDYLEVHDAF